MSKYLKLFQGHNQYTEYMDGESGVVYMPNVSCCINNYHVHYTPFFSILEVTLEASPTQDVAVGDDITYTATITNKGNVNVREGHLYDDHVDLSAKTFSLAPNESETFTYTYTVTQQDIDRGYVVNKLEVNAKSSIGHNPTNVVASTRVEAEDAEAELRITCESTSENPEWPGDIITYEITVENVGNVSIEDGELEDDHADLSNISFDLAPGESETFTYTYQTTQADFDALCITNIVTASATAVRGDDPNDESATETVYVEPNGHLTIDAETTSEEPEGGYALGDTVEYKITVTNDGNLTITDIEIISERTGFDGHIASLAPGASIEYTDYTEVNEEDILSGHIIYEVGGSGTSPDPDKPDVYVTPDECDDEPEDKNGHLTVVLMTTSEEPEGGYALNDTVTYDLYVVNDGNLTITDIEVDCARCDFSYDIASLAPQTSSRVYQISTTVTEYDILSEHIINEATAEGRSPDPDKPDVPVTQETTDDGPEDKRGHLSVEKVTTSTPANRRYYVLGERITYKVTVTNSGNLTITNIRVTDELTENTWTIVSLEPGQSIDLTAFHQVTPEDVADGEVINVATAEGRSPDPDVPYVPIDPGVDPEPCG